jgi:hypothetical protein
LWFRFRQNCIANEAKACGLLSEIDFLHPEATRLEDKVSDHNEDPIENFDSETEPVKWLPSEHSCKTGYTPLVDAGTSRKFCISTDAHKLTDLYDNDQLHHCSDIDKVCASEGGRVANKVEQHEWLDNGGKNFLGTSQYGVTSTSNDGVAQYAQGEMWLTQGAGDFGWYPQEFYGFPVCKWLHAHFYFVCVYDGTEAPTKAPTLPTSSPTKAPTKAPTKSPSSFPTSVPTIHPSQFPTSSPSVDPSNTRLLLVINDIPITGSFECSFRNIGFQNKAVKLFEASKVAKLPQWALNDKEKDSGECPDKYEPITTRTDCKIAIHVLLGSAESALDPLVNVGVCGKEKSHAAECQVCQGNCTSDDDCAGGLECFSKDENQVKEGCDVDFLDGEAPPANVCAYRTWKSDPETAGVSPEIREKSTSPSGCFMEKQISQAVGRLECHFNPLAGTEASKANAGSFPNAQRLCKLKTGVNEKMANVPLASGMSAFTGAQCEATREQNSGVNFELFHDEISEQSGERSHADVKERCLYANGLLIAQFPVKDSHKMEFDLSERSPGRRLVFTDPIWKEEEVEDEATSAPTAPQTRSHVMKSQCRYSTCDALVSPPSGDTRQFLVSMGKSDDRETKRRKQAYKKKTLPRDKSCNVKCDNVITSDNWYFGDTPSGSYDGYKGMSKFRYEIKITTPGRARGDIRTRIEAMSIGYQPSWGWGWNMQIWCTYTPLVDNACGHAKSENKFKLVDMAEKCSKLPNMLPWDDAPSDWAPIEILPARKKSFYPHFRIHGEHRACSDNHAEVTPDLYYSRNCPSVRFTKEMEITHEYESGDCTPRRPSGPNGGATLADIVDQNGLHRPGLITKGGCTRDTSIVGTWSDLPTGKMKCARDVVLMCALNEEPRKGTPDFDCHAVNEEKYMPACVYVPFKEGMLLDKGKIKPKMWCANGYIPIESTRVSNPEEMCKNAAEVLDMPWGTPFGSSTSEEGSDRTLGCFVDYDSDLGTPEVYYNRNTVTVAHEADKAHVCVDQEHPGLGPVEKTFTLRGEIMTGSQLPSTTSCMLLLHGRRLGWTAEAKVSPGDISKIEIEVQHPVIKKEDLSGYTVQCNAFAARQVLCFTSRIVDSDEKSEFMGYECVSSVTFDGQPLDFRPRMTQHGVQFDFTVRT